MKSKLKKISKGLEIKKLLQSPRSSLVIFVAFLLALNFLAAQTSYYLDLTSDRIYTASDASRDILGDLQEPVTVTFYISQDLPADYVVLKTQVQDLLGQYQDLSRGKLVVAYETPDNETPTVQDLATKGIPQLQSEVVEKDKIEVKNFFFGAEITSGSGDKLKREVLPAAPALETFEYSFVSAVSSVSKEQKEVVAFLSGQGEKEIGYAELAKSYAIEQVAISTEAGKSGFYVAPAATDTSAAPAEKEFLTPRTLIIASPQTDLGAGELSVLDNFVASGGKVVVLSEKINIDTEQQGFEVKNIAGNIGDFTKKYGMEIENDLVYDRSNSPISYNQQTFYGTIAVSKDYPYWVKAVRENFSDHVALSKVQSIIFLWASSLKTSPVEGYDVAPLISSTDSAEISTENISLVPGANLAFTNGSQKTLAAIATAQNGGGQVVVIGDSDFVSPGFMQSISDNEIFFLNLIDSISSSANLASIRAKNIQERPLRAMTESEKGYWKAFAILGGAAALGAYGFLRLRKRKRLSRS